MTICLVTAAIPRTIDLFLGPHMQRLGKMGMTVHVASSGEAEVAREQQLCSHTIDFSRSALNIIGHFRAWRQYRQLIDELTASGETLLLHLHTPIAAALARLAIRRSHPVKVLYMAHGLHFLPGEKNLYYWIERAMARCTDLYVLINEDDVISAERLSKHCPNRVAKIPGIGIQRVADDLANELPVELAANAANHMAGKEISEQSTSSAVTLPSTESKPLKRVLVVGILEQRKHPELAVRAAALMDSNVHVHFCGDGPLEPMLRTLAASLGCEHRVHFEGWTENVLPYYREADCLLFLSEREGLPMSVAESLASQLCVVAYDIRGVRDLLQGLNGWKIPTSRTPEAVAQAVHIALDTQTDSDAYQIRARQFSLEASLDAHEAAVRRLMQTDPQGASIATNTAAAGTQPQT